MNEKNSDFAGSSLLNSEEIAFLLRPHTEQSNDLRITPASSGRTVRLANIAAACQQGLQSFFAVPLSVRAIFGENGADNSLNFVFTINRRDISCRLTADDAAVLVTAALSRVHPGGSFQLRGISLAVLQRLLQTLAESVVRADNDKYAAGFCRLCLLLDICDKTVKLLLTITAAKPSELNVKKRLPLAVRQLNRSKITLTAHTCAFTQPVKDVLKWQQGMWIPLLCKPEDPVKLSAAGTAVAQAVIGRKGSNIAAKLTTKVK